MAFHLGKPILTMLAISALSGALIFRHAPAPPPAMNVWVFTDAQARTLREGVPGQPSLVDQYRLKTGIDVQVTQIHVMAEGVRLVSLFNNRSPMVPDIAEMEISYVGKFFMPPASEVGFHPLNEFIERDGLMDKIVPSRFAPWTKGQTIFGIPHDVHPVVITYRKDLFDQAGVDLASAATWPEFHDRCLRFQEYWKSRGLPDRMAIELPTAQSSVVVVMLLQRHLNLIDNNNRVHLDDPRVADTVARYATMVAGPRRIGADTQERGNLWAKAFSQGDVCALITPDWRVTFLKMYAPELKGKLAMMPLPRFDPADAPTSTWGGTMIGIPRYCQNPQASWELLKFLYLSEPALQARRRFTDILPPVRSEWQDSRYHQPDEFFAGQRTGELLVQLADQIPPRHVTPFSIMAGQVMGHIIYKAESHVRAHGTAGLTDACQLWLRQAAHDLEERIRFGTFQ